MVDAKNLLTFMGFSVLELMLIYVMLLVFGYIGVGAYFFTLLASILLIAVGTYLTIFKDNGVVLLLILLLGTVVVAGEVNIDFSRLNNFTIGLIISVLLLYFGSIATLVLANNKDDKNTKIGE